MNELRKAVRRVVLASVLVLAVAFLLNQKAYASVKVEGVPSWLSGAMQRSLDAVWNEAARRNLSNKEEILRLVAKRLFPGLVIESLKEDGLNLYVAFEVSEENASGWKVLIDVPKLSGYLSILFAEDLGTLQEELEGMLDHLPFDVLRWSASDFRKRAQEIIAKNLPGWNGMLVFTQEGGIPVLEVSFSPKEPVVVAFKTSFTSLSLPNVLQADLEEEALEVLSTYVGLPVEWVSKHKKAISRKVALDLEDKWQARKLKGKVEVNLTPQTVSTLKVNVESQKYVLRAWLATYIGAEGRPPEVGVHFGRRTVPISGFDLEAYGEGIIKVDDGDVESRLGARWLLWKNIWIGAERAFPDDEYWGRVWFDEIFDKVYGWARYSEEDEVEAGLGWRIREHIFWELFYDSREEDEFCVRLVGNL